MLEEYLKDWRSVINFKSLYEVLKVLEKDYNLNLIHPSKEFLFSPFLSCPYNDLKIVMIGESNYNYLSNGLLFGYNIDNDDSSILELEILKEGILNYEIPNNSIIDPTMISLANQGILFLKTSLTTNVKENFTHSLLWREFICNLLIKLSEVNPGIIYVLFGKQAKLFKSYINETNYILESIHPKDCTEQIKLDSSLFSIINTISIQKNNIPIKWYNSII